MGWRPNQFFAAPADFQSTAKPKAVVPTYPVPVEALSAAFRAVALTSPRVNIVSEDASRRQVDFVQHSALFRFPDTITVQFIPQGDAQSSLAIYSRAAVGIGDMGVNKKRVLAWLSALSAKVSKD
jgi:uncharacterized protein (DUF1499 family)